MAAVLRSYVDGFIKKVDGLDPSKAMPKMSMKLGKSSKASKKDKEESFDEAPSANVEPVVVEARHRPEKAVGTVTVEVLAAGGWARSGMGDSFSSEDVFALVVCDGGVARTDVKADARVPIWECGERRAFKFDVADPSATLYCALLDEDSDPFSQDDPIGRCAVALRALAPDTTYDAWLPLALKGSEGEAVATATRALVAHKKLAVAATKHDLQKDSRGAVRLRVKVSWKDGGTSAARSALGGLLSGAPARYVACPNTKSGRVLRENVRFAMYGEGCPVGPTSEPFATARVSDHFNEMTVYLAGAISRQVVKLVALIAYVRPLRSLLALAAWCTTVASPARAAGWFWLFAFLDLRDALAGDRLPDDVGFGKAPRVHPRAPSAARPQLTFSAWLRAFVGLSAPAAYASDDHEAAEKYAKGKARAVAAEVVLDDIRAKRIAPAAEVVEEEEEDEGPVDDAKCMKTYSSMNPLAPFLRPVQGGLLSVVRSCRALRGLFLGVDDPVATATLAFVCLLCAIGCFFYSEIVHGYLYWALAWLNTITCYGVGVALFGPQNWYFARQAAAKQDAKRSALAAAGFDQKHCCALKIQHWRKACKAKAAEAEAAKAAEAEAAEAAAEEAERQKEEAAAEAARKELMAKERAEAAAEANAAFVTALEERLISGPAIVATKDEGHFGGGGPSELSISDEKFRYKEKGGKEKKIKLLKFTSVKPLDARAPDVLKFSTESKPYKFVFEETADCALVTNALRALTPGTSSDEAGGPSNKKKDFLRLAVPSRPFGFLAASVVERDSGIGRDVRSKIIAEPAASAPAADEPKDKDA